jgi:hypothetical protein
MTDLRKFFFKALRRIPMAQDSTIELDVDPVTYGQAWRNANNGVDGPRVPPGFVDPVSGRIWILVDRNTSLLAFHRRSISTHRVRAPVTDSYNATVHSSKRRSPSGSRAGTWARWV